MSQLNKFHFPLLKQRCIISYSKKFPCAQQILLPKVVQKVGQSHYARNKNIKLNTFKISEE